MTSDEERILVAKAQGGDRESLGILWDAITPKLFGYLLSLVSDKALAEDLLQTTWLKAIEALPKFEQRGIRFSSWLFAIARNESRQHWRRAKREIPLDPLAHDIPAKDAAQTSLLVEQSLALLSEDDRELIRLRYIADMPLLDMARTLNLNFVTVRVRLHRALNRARLLINSQKT